LPPLPLSHQFWYALLFDLPFSLSVSYSIAALSRN
jgi:hypothetical protein